MQEKIYISKNNHQALTLEKDEQYREIAIFSWWEGKKKIRIEEWASLKYLFICSEKTELTLEIETWGHEANIVIKGIFLWKDASKVISRLKVDLRHDRGQANVHLVSFLQEGSDCQIDGNIIIGRWTKWCDGHLLEENILLGEKMKIKTLPMLDVRSDDVTASHGAKIERLDDKKLFYMQAKGIPKQEAKKLLIQWYFENLFQLISHDVCVYCDERKCGVKSEVEEIEELKREWLEYLLRKW